MIKKPLKLSDQKVERITQIFLENGYDYCKREDDSFNIGSPGNARLYTDVRFSRRENAFFLRLKESQAYPHELKGFLSELQNAMEMINRLNNILQSKG